MLTSDTAPATNRPYGPPSNLTSLLARLRSRNLPAVVDAEYLRDSGIPEGTVSRTLLGLKFLGLIGEDGRPDDALRRMHTSTEDEYRSILADKIRQAYADVFEVVDPGEDSSDQVANVFRKYTPASQRQRMLIFFLGMCREAGIPVAEASSTRKPSAGPRPVSSRGYGALPRNVRRTPPPTIAVSPALEALVKSLPPAGTSLPHDRREKWLEMARAALAFLYPDEADDKEGGEEGA